jgi:transcriptional regulator with XRE-family HTH domain
MEEEGNKPVPRTELEPVCVALAEVIRERRVQAGFSLGQLAVRTGLSRQMLSYVETGRRVPSVDSLARIARAFGVRGSRLLAEAEG